MRRGLVPVLNACVRDGGGRGPKGLTASAIYQALPIPGLIIGSSAQAAGDSAAAVFRRNKVLVAIKIKLSVEIAWAAASRATGCDSFNLLQGSRGGRDRACSEFALRDARDQSVGDREGDLS